jgi:cytochrome c oxidase cbb3-type subunit 3
MIAFYDQQAQEFLALGEITEHTLIDLTNNDAMMAGAEQLFQSKCSQCHGMNGEGSIGPNLTDDYWLHGQNLTDIYQTVADGVPAKGMLAWKNQLRPAELLSVSAYIGTLRGSEPADPKKPQGDLLPYTVPEAAADSGDDGEAPEAPAEEAEG